MGKKYEDSHKNLGEISIKKAFAMSSNVAFAKLGVKYFYENPSVFLKEMSRLKIFESTGIDLINEPYFAFSKDHYWKGTTVPSAAIGYGLKISPLHTCMLYNAIANNGKMMKPYLISAILPPNGRLRLIHPEVVLKNVANPNEIQQVKECLKTVVDSGTAAKARSSLYSFSGKTGTARVADRGLTYDDKVYQASFIGYFPSESPQYTIAVVMRTKSASKEIFGAELALPVFRQITDYLFLKKNGTIDLNSNVFTCITSSNQSSMIGNKIQQSHTEKINTDTMPNLRGWNFVEALKMLESNGIKVRVFGGGNVDRQSVPAGKKIKKGDSVTVYLSLNRIEQH